MEPALGPRVTNATTLWEKIVSGLTRSYSVAGSTALAAFHALPRLGALRLATPRQTAGPFYPVELPLDDDNDLTHVKGCEERALGQISDLTGRIVDRNGGPLDNLRIEIWQCDANGRYRFRTIRPVPYPGRTPHIHVAVFPSDQPPFVTQL
jgi:protocatechuate 3,4-dioxygenase beta subunit